MDLFVTCAPFVRPSIKFCSQLILPHEQNLPYSGRYGPNTKNDQVHNDYLLIRKYEVCFVYRPANVEDRTNECKRNQNIEECNDEPTGWYVEVEHS